MKKRLLSLAVVFLLLANVSLQAQEVEAKWKTAIGMNAKWIKLLPTGAVLVSTQTSLVCFDASTQQKLWETKTIAEVPKETFTEIDGTPFAIFESNNPLKSLKAQTTIIDYMTGRVIYNNVDADVVVREKTPLLDMGALLLELKQEKKVFLALIDIQSGQERWRFDLPGRKAGIGIGALKQSIKSMLDASPVSDKDNNILFPDDKILKRIDGATGKLLWESINDKSVGRLNFSDDGSVIYLGSGNKIKAMNLADGKEIWKDAFKISGEFKMFVPTKEERMYVVTSTELSLIDRTTGKAVWKKPAPFATSFASLRFTDEGIIVFGTEEKVSSFDYIGFDGQALWKRPYRTDVPIVSFDLTSKGILFANADEANMIDMKTGDDSIWKKRIKTKGQPATYIGEKMALIYGANKLYRVDLEKEGSPYTLIAEDIKFKGSDEDVQRIELVSSGYLLSSSQNMWVISPEGKVVYSVYYKAASVSTGLKVLGAVGKVYNTYSNLETSYDPTTGVNTIGRSQRGDDIAGGINSILAKRKNTFATQDAAFMMTRVEDGNGKSIGMIKVDKVSGQEKGKVILKALDPIYEVDYATGLLFVIVNSVTGGSDLTVYSL